MELVRDTARFLDDRVLEAGGRRFEPDYVVIASGSEVNVPDIPGIRDVDYMTSGDVLDATELPDTGVVIGFGAIGLEMAPYLSEVGGVDVTVVEHDDRPLDAADPGFGDAVMEQYRELFDVEILTNRREERLEPTGGGGARLHLDYWSTVEADGLFVFTGRRPALDRLELGNTSLSPGPGWVRDTMQARSDPRLFVVGDATGRDLIGHVAKEAGGVAAENILRLEAGEEPRRYAPIHHRVVFSGLGIYPFARVGHSESSAEDAGLDYAAVTREARKDGVFRTKNVPKGFAKLLVDRRNGTVLGYQGLHYQSDVMAKTMQLAVEMELDVRELPSRAYHPTTPELLDGLIREAVERVGSSASA